MRLALSFFLFPIYFKLCQNQILNICDGINVRDKFHIKIVLARDLDRPYQLSTFRPEQKIFFSYNIGNEQNDTFLIGYIEKDVAGFKNVSEVKNGFATAIDRDHNIAYFGGSDGIYEYKYEHNKSEINHIIHNHNIWDMFYKNHLYFVEYPSQHLYKYSNGKVQRQELIHEKIYQFVIDGDDDKFITNGSGLFMIKNHTTHRIHIEGVTTFRAIEVDNKGEAFFCGKHDIFVVNKHDHKLTEIAKIRNIFGLTFDHEDNIIYSNPHEIIKLEPSTC